MQHRKLLITLIVALFAAFVIDGSSLAQRAGRSSGGSSAGRSSGGSSAGRSSAGRSSGASRASSGASRASSGASRASSAGRSVGRSSTSRSSTPSRASSATRSQSRGSVPSRSSTPVRSSPVRSSSPTRSTSRTSTTRPTYGSSSTGTRSATTPSYTGRGSTGTRTTTPTYTGRTSTGTRSTAPTYGGTRTTGTRTTTPTDVSRSSGYTGTTSGGYTRDNSGGYTGRTSRSTVTSAGDTNRSAIDLAPSRSRTRSSGSSVPQLYGSNDKTPSSSRRLALTERLRAATSAEASRPGSGRSVTTATNLADRYTPSARDRARTGTATRPTTAERSTAARPGEVRRAAADSLRTRPTSGRTAPTTGRTRDAGARPTRPERPSSRERLRERKNSKNGNGDGLTARERTEKWKKQQRRYYQAAEKDPGLRKRMSAASGAAARAGDIALRTALGSNPITAQICGYGGDRWSGYGTGGCGSWYWNCWYPSWCCGWFGGGCWWNPCSSWGWGWGWGWNNCWWWGGGNWGWPGYCYWPTYGWFGPSVVYETVYETVYVEAEEEPIAEEGAAQGPAPADSGLAARAAAEYMALGDRAFVEGRYGDSVHYYAKAIEYSPEDGVLYLVLSDALFATGDYHYCAFSVRRSLELSPELAVLEVDKRTFYGDPADFDSQVELLELYLADHFLDEDARLVLAANYLFSAQPQRCVELLDSPFSEAIRKSEAGQLMVAAAVGSLAAAAE